MGKARKSNRLLYVLIAGLILLTVTGAGLLGAYFFLSQPAPVTTGWVNPLDAVIPEAVAPDLAALSLTGEPDDRIIRAAMDAGEYETAYATLAYSLFLPDNVRSGQWLLMCSRFQETDPRRAAACYRTALDQVALSPLLSDVARGDAALQVSRGFAALNAVGPARLALSEAENVARYSLVLLPAQRRSLLQQVVASYRAIGDVQTAATIERDLAASSAGPGIRLEPAAPLLPGLRGTITLPESVAAAIAVRQVAAADMAARWLASGPSVRTTLIEALGQALLAEDSARSEFYANATDLSPADRLALLHDQVAWLTVKYRVAQGAYGEIQLVADWEADTESIRAALASAYTELINGYGKQLDTLGAGDATVGRVELLRQGVLWTRLGLFPDHAEALLSEQLTDASRQLWTRQGGAGLVIVVQETEEGRFYLLSGAAGSEGGE